MSVRSTFSGFNIARSGFFAAQRALDITGHNIANVNTRGYTRQRLEQEASNPMRIPGGEGMLGTGVTTTAIHQLRNEFLDYKYRDESSSLGYWEARADGLDFIEAIMNEPSETGITTVIDKLFESFQELSKNGDNLTTRALVRQRAITFTNSVNHMYNQLEKMAVDLNFDINSMVKQINAFGRDIADLNDQIMRAELDGNKANDLRDKRNVLIDDLSKIVDIEVLDIKNPDNPKHSQMLIKVAGKALVYHKDFTGLELEAESSEFFKDEVDKNIDLYQIKWADGTDFDTGLISGQLKGLLVLRDGQEGDEKGIPYYIKELNKFVNVFANEINKIHLEGYNLHGETGIAFFTANGVTTPKDAKIEFDQAGNLILGAYGDKNPGDDYENKEYDEDGNLISTSPSDGNKSYGDLISGSHDEFGKINASNIRITIDIEDPNKIAAAKEKELLPKDSSVMLDIVGLRHKSSMFREGKPEDFIKSLIGTLGVDADEAKRNTLNQEILLQDIENRRQSISGVNQDEELANMVRFQHAYNASARMMTTMDEMLDVLINRVGIVGR